MSGQELHFSLGMSWVLSAYELRFGGRSQKVHKLFI